MTQAELASLIGQYHADLEAELALLVRLQVIAARQQQTTLAADIGALKRAADERDALMSGWVAIAGQIRPAHERLTRERTAALGVPEYHETVGVQQAITRMVSDILEIDRDSIRALEQIVADRRAATQAAEQAEATLAAYGRMLSPRPSATLINRRG